MAGTARTNKFMLGTATVMIGKQADLYKLTPANSIGLVKNFSLTSEPAYTELTQGVKNTIVNSVMTTNPVRASMEVYEYTARNLAWGLGLDGTNLPKPGDAEVATTTSEAIDGDPTADTAVAVNDATNLAVNDYIWIVDSSAVGGDGVYVTKIIGKAGSTLTLSPGIPADIASGAKVLKVQKIGVGSKDEQPFLCAKVVGTLADNSHVTILIPKLRISKGFNMAFHTDNFGNLPFEFSVYDLVDADGQIFTDFGGDSARIFVSQ